MIGCSIIMSHVLSYPSTTMTHSEAPVVPLPPRSNTSVNPPVWSVDAPPSTPKCSRPDGVCCKKLIEEERTLIDPDVVRDVYVQVFLTWYSKH